MDSSSYSDYFIELKGLWIKYAVLEELHDKFIEQIKEGIPDNSFSQIEFYDYIAKTLANYTSKDPVFSKFASVYQTKIYGLTVGTDYKSLINKQFEEGLISDSFYNFVSSNCLELENMIVWERDNLIDYFGLKTLERSYLLKDKSKNFIERPQMMWLRVAIQIHGLSNVTQSAQQTNSLELIKETYDYMSQLYFTHATPTLFNSGSKYPQLSSCYLLQCPDDLDQIGTSFKSIMLISKWAGGIGINLSDIRSNNSIIKSTGGRTSGIIPLCKTLESLARYINQCFSKNTIVYSKNGPIKVENVKINDELITKDGTYQKVLKIFTNDVDKELLKIRVTHSFEPTIVTNEHQIYAITNQSKIINFSVIRNRLDKKIIKPIFVSASDLKSGDFISFPIPKFINDVQYDSDFFRLYGIILGDGHVTKRKYSTEFGITLNSETKIDIYNFVVNYLRNKQIHYWIFRQDEKKTVFIRWTQNINKLKISYDDIYDENHNKKINSEYLHLPKNKTLALIKGLLETDGHCDKEIYFNTSSRPLAFSIRYLFLRIGILTSGHIRPSGDTHEIRPGENITTKKNGYVIRIPKHPELKPIFNENIKYSSKFKFFEYSGLLWSRIKTIDKETYKGIVYDFNMENNHNYLTDMGLVHNSGKRLGSIAGFLETWHADIEDFIELRKNTGDDNLRARDLFLGLWVSDNFMKAIETDGDWYLMNPNISTGLTDSWGKEFENLYNKYVSENKYVKKIKARELYKKITECQFETGMPYMMFKDNINSRSNQQNLGTIKNSNLCVAPETVILTDKGYFAISTLKDKKVNVWNGEKFSQVTVRQTGSNQKLIKVNFSNNESIECTPYHKFFIDIGGKKKILEAGELKENMKIFNFTIPILDKCVGHCYDQEFIMPPTLYGDENNIRITSIEDLGRRDDTYCFNEPEKHAGIFDGILTGNCSEIVEYSSPDEIAVCNLASVSLPKFVKKSNGIAQFDFIELGKVVQIITQNLNNIIDINFYPVPQTSKSNLAHRPIGIGVQGLADCYFLMGYSFDSDEAIRLNKQIFECIYWNSLTKSVELAKLYGPYSSFKGSPFSKGLLQFHLAGLNQIQVADKELGLDWDNLIEQIKKFGTRNCLLTTIMPTASTAQILNNNESIEPYASNIYVRKVLAGEYTIVNKHLVEDLKEIGLWNSDILAELMYDNGSVQNLDIPNHLKNKYKTAYELKQSVIVKQAIDRGIFVDQSQSMNLFMGMPDHNKLASAHIYAWKNGLKTGSYYIRSQPVTEAAKFSIDIELINSIKTKRGIKNLNIDNLSLSQKKITKYSDNVCESCSA
jgi:ribonucleotide reductase alpha subunit